VWQHSALLTGAWWAQHHGLEQNRKFRLLMWSHEYVDTGLLCCWSYVKLGLHWTCGSAGGRNYPNSSKFCRSPTLSGGFLQISVTSPSPFSSRNSSHSVTQTSPAIAKQSEIKVVAKIEQTDDLSVFNKRLSWCLTEYHSPFYTYHSKIQGTWVTRTLWGEMDGKILQRNLE
jgi:hypothetical protein